MKKALAIILTIVICMLATACSNGANSQDVLEQLTEYSTSAISSDGETLANESNDSTGNTKESDSNEASEANEGSQADSNSNGNNENNSSNDNNTGNGNSSSNGNDQAGNSGISTTTATTKPQNQSSQNYCYVTIECTAILNNIDDLAPGHENYVPKSGYILSGYKCTYKSGDTAYDILCRACNENGIPVNARTSSYGTYVAGINNLDEFDCGEYSGWLYSVNGTKPPISCGKKAVTAGDTIKFSYTCTGQ